MSKHNPYGHDTTHHDIDSAFYDTDDDAPASVHIGPRIPAAAVHVHAAPVVHVTPYGDDIIPAADSHNFVPYDHRHEYDNLERYAKDHNSLDDEYHNDIAHHHRLRRVIFGPPDAIFGPSRSDSDDWVESDDGPVPTVED